MNRRYRFQSSGYVVNPTWSADFSSIPCFRHSENVELYVLDTGSEEHSQFEDRVGCGYDPIDGDCRDTYGHGTHVAATAAVSLSYLWSNSFSSTFQGIGYGVAKDASVVTVRVLGQRDGGGSISAVIGGIDYVIGQKQQRSDTPMVVNMSLGTSYSRSLNDAVTRLSDAGVVVIVSAGNDSDDACNYSPASAADAITVGSIDKVSISHNVSFAEISHVTFSPGQWSKWL